MIFRIQFNIFKDQTKLDIVLSKEKLQNWEEMEMRSPEEARLAMKGGIISSIDLDDEFFEKSAETISPMNPDIISPNIQPEVEKKKEGNLPKEANLPSQKNPSTISQSSSKPDLHDINMKILQMYQDCKTDQEKTLLKDFLFTTQGLYHEINNVSPTEESKKAIEVLEAMRDFVQELKTVTSSKISKQKEKGLFFLSYSTSD